MYHIPTCKSAMQEHLKHSLESQASAEVDETCHSALKEGGLGMLSTDGMFMPLTSGSSSSMLAIGDNNDGGETLTSKSWQRMSNVAITT